MAKAEVRALDKQIGTMRDRIMDATTPTVIGAYEKKIATLEAQKLLAIEKAENAGTPQHSFAELFEHALVFLANPWKIWENGNLHLRRTVMKLAFDEQIPYHRKQDFEHRKYRYRSKL